MLKVLSCIVSFACLSYLAGGILLALQASVFLLLLQLPLLAVGLGLPRLDRVNAETRLAFSILFLFASNAGLYILRQQNIAPPFTFDLILGALAYLAAVRLAAFSRLRSTISGCATLLDWPLFLPLLFLHILLLWSGFAVESNGSVEFYGLFPQDFLHLSAVVSTVSFSPLPNLSAIAGFPIEPYHWAFMCLPAWLSDFGPLFLADANALVISNLLSALLLVLALSGFIRAFCGTLFEVGSEKLLLTASVFLVLYASPITHLIAKVATFPGLDILQVSGRNSLLLSAVNSMAVFGNNTAALAGVLVLLQLFRYWQKDGGNWLCFYFFLLFLFIASWSITVAIAVAPFFAVLFLLPGFKFRLQAVVIGSAVAVCSLGVLLFLGVVSTESTRSIGIQFDSGQFLKAVFLFHLPLVITSVLAWRSFPRLRLPGGLLLWILLSVSFTYVSGGLPSDLSMKNGSLVQVLAAPFIFAALQRLVSWPVKRRLLALPAAVVMVLGLAHSFAYINQAAAARSGLIQRQATYSLDADYFELLGFVAEHCDRRARLLDLVNINASKPDEWPVAIAERSSALPFSYGGLLAVVYENQGSIQSTRSQSTLFLAGKESGESLAKFADLIVVRPLAPALSLQTWKLLAKRGSFKLYERVSAKKSPAEVCEALRKADRSRNEKS